MKLLVRNLARTTTEKELRALFIQFGRVQSCDLVLDKVTGQSKGFAFIEMPKAGEAKVAVKELNNRDVAGNKIRVKKAESKTENKADAHAETQVGAENQVDGTDTKVASVTSTGKEGSQKTTKKFSWKERKLT